MRLLLLLALVGCACPEEERVLALEDQVEDLQTETEMLEAEVDLLKKELSTFIGMFEQTLQR
jgi:hypothetical protein